MQASCVFFGRGPHRVQDITGNPKHIEIRALESAQLPRVSSDVEFAVMRLRCGSSSSRNISALSFRRSRKALPCIREPTFCLVFCLRCTARLVGCLRSLEFDGRQPNAEPDERAANHHPARESNGQRRNHCDVPRRRGGWRCVTVSMADQRCPHRRGRCGELYDTLGYDQQQWGQLQRDRERCSWQRDERRRDSVGNGGH